MRNICIILLLLSIMSAGCKNRDSDEYGFMAKFYEPLPGTVPGSQQDGTYDLNADTNRDGTAETGGTEDTGESTWNSSYGAVMVYNNDDDDNDTNRDHSNTSVDGAGDEPDITPLLIKQISSIEAGAYATLDIDAEQTVTVAVHPDAALRPRVEQDGEVAEHLLVAAIAPRRAGDLAPGRA